MKNLDYRRQFLIGKNFTLENWNEIKIVNSLKVSIHPDLEYEKIERNKFKVILIGYLINPYYPNNSNLENLVMLTEDIKEFKDLIANTYEYGGRWVLVYSDGETVKLINDPCGMRQVYYTTKENIVWCGSQPNIISDILNIERSKDTEIAEYLNSDFYENSDRSWYGDGTAFEGIKHMLPNHYLNASNGEVKRYWLDDENGKKVNDLSNTAKEMLAGSILAINNRYSTMMAITAGWDSRLLLAASKEVKDKIYYFVSTSNKLSNDHMDIKVPNKLLSKLGLEFHIIDKLPSMRDSFMKKISKNVFNARNPHKTLNVQYYHDFLSDKLSVNGNASEIARSYYGEKHPDKITAKYLMRKESLPNISYIEKQLNEWLVGAESLSDKSGVSIMDLFYWEQRMGNWGAMAFAEQDIAIETFTPYNNRKILMALLNIDSKYRNPSSNKIYKRIINELWKETLSEPINPQKLATKVKYKLVGFIPIRLKIKIKKYLKN